jgi:hypothetical protein
MKNSLALACLLLAVSSAHAERYGASKMLRDASIYHDEERIRSLLSREVEAEQSNDYTALKEVLRQLGAATKKVSVSR